MGKFKSRKFYAAALAAVLAVTAVPRIDLGTMQLANAVQSVLDFQQQLAAMKAPQTDAVPFVSLHYDAEQDMLYRDGKPVGDRLGEYAVIDGNVMLSAKAAGVGDADAGYVLLEQAAKQIGCTITEEKDGVTVTSPFDSACLIVRAEGEIEQYGAIDCVENRDGIRVLQYATPADAYCAYQKYATDDRVDFVEPSRTVSLAAADAEEKAYSYISDENTDWGVTAIGAETYNQNLIANNETLPEIVVAVVDTGIYYEHERFVNRIAGHGAAFLDYSTYTVDDQHGHGTHCAGIIVGATTDNVKILPVRALDADGYGSSVGIYCGMLYAMEQGADVVSMSLGISGESPLVQYTVDQLYDAGIVCCVASGNESMNADNVTPARAEHAITVGAVDEYKEIAYFSNYGSAVDVVAPGVDVWSAGIEAPDSFVYMSGTSMATPYVAACSAMVLSADETLSVDDVDAFLKANSIDLGESGKDDTFGYGMVYMGDFVFDGTYCAAPEIYYTDETADTLGTVDISMFCATEGAKIYYTLDGTTPDKENGILYTEEFTVSESTLVKAVSYLGDKVGGYSEAAIVIGGLDAPNALVIEDGVLVAYNGVLAELDWSDRTDITAIGDSAFAGNTKIEDVLLPEKVTAIGAHAFESCSNLNRLVANGVTAVGEAAFRNSSVMRLNTAPLETLGEAAFENCTGLWKIPLSEELTEIPARFLKHSGFSNTLALPNVTVIGDEAFLGCDSIEFSDWNWGAITKVGKEAFRGCRLEGVYADFEALETIGEGAFRECYNLAGITLPATMTELPAYLLAYASWLEYLKAPGVTVVGDYALALHSGFSVETAVEIPFAQITTVGESAFEGFYFPESVDFTALTEIGVCAFASTRGGMLSFPALQKISVGGFTGAKNPALYFENATSIAEYAFDVSTAIVVLSDACTEIDKTAFSVATIAAPAGSAAADFALANRIAYIETPTVYAPNTDYTFALLDEESIEGYGLGFGMQYQWYDGEGKAIAGATDYIYYPDTQQGETDSYTLKVTDANGDLCGTLDFTVTVDPVKITADLTADTVILSDYDSLMDEWDTVTSSADYDYNFTAYRYYSFTPKANGTYYFHLSDCYSSGSTIALYGADLEQNQFETTKYLTAQLTAGETYTLVICYDDKSAFAGALGVSTIAPDDIYGMRGSYWMDTSAFSDGIVPEKYPYVPELKLFNPNFASSGLVLTEGDDLLILMTNNDKPGQMTVYAFGQGRFLGAMDRLNITLLQSVKEEEAITVIPVPGEQGMQFIPKKDGTYSILTAYALDYLAGRPDAEIMNAVLNADPYFYIDGDDAYEYADDYQNGETTSLLAAVTVELTAGTKYTIGVSSYGDAPFELYVTRVKKNLLDCEMLCTGWDEDAVVTLYDANGDLLTQGKDYTLQSFVSNYGDVYAVAKGMGDYYGTLYVQTGNQEITIGGIPEPCVDIELGVPFTYDPNAACYRVTIDQICDVQLKTNGTDSAVFDMFRLGDDGTLTMYSGSCTHLGVISVNAGTYIIEMHHFDSEITGELTLASVLGIFDASYFMDDLTYTGDTLVPQPEIYYDGELLVQGVDYTLGGDVSVIECGYYVLNVYGIGRFGGVLEIYYKVNPNLSSATETLHDGENEIVLNRAGGTGIYKWVPEKTGEYVIACLDVYDVSLSVMNEDGEQLTTAKGYDEVYGFAFVTAGETYYVTAAFSATDMTGSFTLLLEKGKRNFAACESKVDDVYYVSGEAIEPKPVISYGGQRLTEGVDYTIVTYGANLNAGEGCIELKGMGNYIGRMSVAFDIYLENIHNLDIAADDFVEAVPDETYNFAAGDLDDSLLLKFTNTTGNTDIFSIDLVEEDAYYIVQAYDADGVPILDFNDKGFMLPAGETIYLYLVTNRIWWDEEGHANLTICATDYFYGAYNGLYFMANTDGIAFLYNVEGDRFSYEIEDSFVYNGKEINIIGCCEDVHDYLYWNQQVFYVSSVDNGIGLALLEEGFVAVSLANISKVAGDADGDGDVDGNDIVLFNGYVCETAVIADGNLANCDLNSDGAIDYNDLGILLANFHR